MIPTTLAEANALIASLERKMRALAKDLAFEEAARVRDQIRALREQLPSLSA